MIRTLLTEWAYARGPTAAPTGERDPLDDYRFFYDFHQPHSALNYQPPASRLPAALCTTSLAFTPG